MITIKGGSWYYEDMHMDRENDQEARLWMKAILSGNQN